MADGITHAVMTPHVHVGVFDNRAQGIEQAVAGFRDALTQHDIALQISAGGEVRIGPELIELLLSPKFALAINRLKDLFEVIVIDTPPVQLVSDALIISQLTTGVIYVIKADDTPLPLARQGIIKVRRSGASILGVALNQLDFKRADRYYGEYSGYANYGYKSHYGSKT